MIFQDFLPFQDFLSISGDPERVPQHSALGAHSDRLTASPFCGSPCCACEGRGPTLPSMALGDSFLQIQVTEHAVHPFQGWESVAVVCPQRGATVTTVSLGHCCSPEKKPHTLQAATPILPSVPPSPGQPLSYFLSLYICLAGHSIYMKP